MKKSFIAILFISTFLGFSVLSSCDDSTDVVPEDQTPVDTVVIDTIPVIKAVYISTQAEFDRLKNATYLAGTYVLFEAGKVFNGQFAPLGSGTEDEPIIVSAYDPETKEMLLDNIDNKPIINGNSLVEAPFYLYNESNWIISNLEITNTDGTDDDQGDIFGIYIVEEDAGIVENLIVRYCYIHDVNGKVEGKGRGGIHTHVKGSDIPTQINNLLIEENLVSYVGGVGIGNVSSWGGVQDDDYYPWENHIIRGNRVEHTGRNAIIIRMSINPVAEYNVLPYSSRYSTGHSIFNFNTDGMVMQYNEAYGNTGELDEHDRGGFDADYNAHNTFIQYNYSHDNHWFCGMMRKYNKGITLRYNLTVNEKLGAYEYGFPSDVGIEDVLIHNNTHYFKAGLNASPFASPGKTRTPINTKMYNNIFYFEDASEWAVEADESCELSHNLFYNISEIGTNNIITDPLFVNQGENPYDVDMKAADRLSGYQLMDNSPCFDAGKVIVDNGGLDFWGKPLSDGLLDIGAFEKQ